MIKTEILYNYNYILGLLFNALMSAKKANFKRNIPIPFLLVINKSPRSYKLKSKLFEY